MMKGLMEFCLSQEKWVDCLKEKVKAIDKELNELKARKEVLVKKLTVIKKALEELEGHVDELRKVLQDKKEEISTLREQVRRVKDDGKVEFRGFDGFFIELNNCYFDGFLECLRQIKALYPNLDVSLVALGLVAQTLARTVNQEDTDVLFEADSMPNVQGDGKAAPEHKQAKSVKDENCLVGEEEKPKKVVNEAPPVDQPQFFCKIYCLVLFFFSF